MRLQHWSPDRQKLAFCSNRDGNVEIYSMSADGSNQTRLTNNSSQDWTPKWSPDGSRIAFVAERDGNREIYVMDPDGGNQTRVTNNPASDIEPDWSPDGSHMVFISERNGNQDIYIAALTVSWGFSDLRQLTADGSVNRHPIFLRSSTVPIRHQTWGKVRAMYRNNSGTD